MRQRRASLRPEKFKVDPILSNCLIDRIRLKQRVDDTEFDQIFAGPYQVQSSIHWSTIAVAYQIAEWIGPLNKKSFIDIGCGVGKLCVLLGILTQYEIYGIEQRLKLVLAANKVIEKNNFKNISVLQMNMLELDWQSYDIYYLYNPFHEHLMNGGFSVLEHDLDFDQKFYTQYTTEVLKQLNKAKPNKVLITFHGYGGPVPTDWKLVSSKHVDNGELTMWIKN